MDVTCTYKLPIQIGKLLSDYRSAKLKSVSDGNKLLSSSSTAEKGANGQLYFCSLENFESAVVYLPQVSFSLLL
jgi:hypothetical protein